MTRSAALQRRIAALARLRTCSDSELHDGLRAALVDANNHIVAKAAAIAAERGAAVVLPDLLAAYDRLFVDEPPSDLLALGKTAIAQALAQLDYRLAEPFVRGLTHVQLEPAWVPGGTIDVAADLRATCALALPACDLDDATVMRLLVERLGIDTHAKVRADAVRAIAALGGESAIVVLRLKAYNGDREPEVVGECFTELLAREPRESIAFIEWFLRAPDDGLSCEAAYALAAASEPSAFDVLARWWREPLTNEVRRTIVLCCASSRCIRAADFLLSCVDDVRPAIAAAAIESLARSRFRDAYADRLRRAVRRAERRDLHDAFRAAFGESDRTAPDGNR